MNQLHPKAVWLFFFQFLILIPLCAMIFFVAFSFIFAASLQKTFLRADTIIPLLFMTWIGGLIFGLAIIVFLTYFWALLTYKNYKYQFTSEAVKIEKGVIWKKYISIPYERIQNVDIYRGILDRILGLSDLHVQTAGYSGYFISEGRIPGLDPKVAEEFREELIKKVKGTKQGL